MHKIKIKFFLQFIGQMENILLTQKTRFLSPEPVYQKDNTESGLCMGITVFFYISIETGALANPNSQFAQAHIHQFFRPSSEFIEMHVSEGGGEIPWETMFIFC